MYALMESADAINLFKNDRLVASYKFESAEHAQRIYVQVLKGVLPDEVANFLLDNDVDDLVVDKSLVKCGQKGACKSIKFVENQNKLRRLRETMKIREESVRGLSHSMAHKNVNFYTLDPLIAQSYCMLKQIENDIERYDKRAAEIYFNYLPELKIRKRRDESDDEKVEYKQLYDVEVIKKLWKIKENEDIDSKYLWTRDSVGVALSPNDWANLQKLIDLVELKRENMEKLLKYLEQQVEIHAPNLNALIGFRLAAELITLCGSLINLAKCSSSTVQVLGAEKALFRSLKSKTPTPKYGILKNNEITKSPRLIRSLASKIVLCARIDVFRRTKTDAYGKALRAALETKIKTNKKVLTDEVLAKVTERLRETEKENVDKEGEEEEQAGTMNKRFKSGIDDQGTTKKTKKGRLSQSAEQKKKSVESTRDEKELPAGSPDRKTHSKKKHSKRDDKDGPSDKKTKERSADPCVGTDIEKVGKTEKKDKKEKLKSSKDLKQREESCSRLDSTNVDAKTKDKHTKRKMSVAKDEESAANMDDRRKTERRDKNETKKEIVQKNDEEKVKSSSKTRENRKDSSHSSKKRTLKGENTAETVCSAAFVENEKRIKTNKNEEKAVEIENDKLPSSTPRRTKQAVEIENDKLPSSTPRRTKQKAVKRIKMPKEDKTLSDDVREEEEPVKKTKITMKDAATEKEENGRSKGTPSRSSIKKRKSVTGSK